MLMFECVLNLNAFLPCWPQVWVEMCKDQMDIVCVVSECFSSCFFQSLQEMLLRTLLQKSNLKQSQGLFIFFNTLSLIYLEMY